MHDRYRHLLDGPGVWSHMDAGEWDLVPQPMRAMAVLGMIDGRVRLYRPGEHQELPLDAMADRPKAIAMLESWFQHRAVNENADGSRDVGIAQASDCMRSRIRVLHVSGRSDFGLAEDDYTEVGRLDQRSHQVGQRLLREPLQVRVEGDEEPSRGSRDARVRSSLITTTRARSVWYQGTGTPRGPIFSNSQRSRIGMPS